MIYLLAPVFADYIGLCHRNFYRTRFEPEIGQGIELYRSEARRQTGRGLTFFNWF